MTQDIRGYYDPAALGIAGRTSAAWEATRRLLRSTEEGRPQGAARQAPAQESDASFKVWFYLTPNDA